MSHSIQTIPVLREYFGTDELPIIRQTFEPKRGWKTYPMNKRVSRSWLRKLRREGATYVHLVVRQPQTRAADFSIAELLGATR